MLDTRPADARLDANDRPASHEGQQGSAQGDIDAPLEDPGARWVEPMEVVDDDNPWAVAVEEMLEVAAGERADRGRDLAGIDGHKGRLLLPPRERGVASDRGDRAGPAPGDRLVDVTGQEELANE